MPRAVGLGDRVIEWQLAMSSEQYKNEMKAPSGNARETYNKESVRTRNGETD
jgi:hypothetical protein